jgi:glycerophosphoryl diester phosphodiesterase
VDAIRGAISRGYDGVEIDVQVCGTGEIVVFHDVYVDHRFVCYASLAELGQLGVHSLAEIYESVPELHETLVLMDIKGADVSVASALDAFYAKLSVEKVVFCSFNRKILTRLPARFKRGTTSETTFLRSEYSTMTAGMSAAILHWTCLDHEFISHCKRAGIAVYTYTHKEDEEHEYMCRFDVDGIITNGLEDRYT